MSEIPHSNTPEKANRSKLLGGWKMIDTISFGINRKLRMRIIIALGCLLLTSILLLSFLSQRFEAGDLRTSVATLVLVVFVGALLFAALLLIELLLIFRNRGIEGPTQRRLITLFVMMALIPTVFVAIISTITLNFGVDNWFSGRVRNVLTTSYETAKAYDREHESRFMLDGDLVYERFVFSRQNPVLIRRYPSNRDGLIYAIEGSSGGISHSFILGKDNVIIARGPRSYSFNIVYPTKEQLEQLSEEGVVFIKRPEQNELIYLRDMGDEYDYYMYLSREVDGRILSLLDQSEKTVSFYKDSEQARQNLLFGFGVFYLTVSVIILMLAIWAALFFSTRLTKPIGRLVRAAERISKGDFSSRVLDSGSNDEFSLLSNTFNQMASNVQENQKELKKAIAVSNAEKRRFNKVLEGVSSGVMGVDSTGKINFINSPALNLLKIEGEEHTLKVEDVAPEFVEAWQKALQSDENHIQEQMTLIREGTQETIFLRATPADRRKTGNTILSFDVVSDLVQAQRLAAWGDVARRIAHEIKNPLTPIRLSAERINRRFAKQMSQDQEKFTELTGIIVRQTQDIQHIVDEFARFSRMPEASKTQNDWIKVIRDSMTLHEQNTHEVMLTYSGVDQAIGIFDPAQIGQAFTNLLKNAIESVEARIVRDDEQGAHGKISVKTQLINDMLEVEIEDNGLGFPSDKTRLFEPYMTLKETGTGLGLPIVKKIIEDHDGRISLHDRSDQIKGARIQIRVPVKVKMNIS